ncbi:hypothetical protein ACQPW1_10580 [Nocardia sp. CA-128927]|uniref:hypothetical protein n=1 Tax=Nocardia sp. CA-128927 TaxID=3239975 RepID=UPI003D971BAE
MSSTPYRYAAYLESWAEPGVSEAARSNLANYPSYIGTIILSYMMPDSTYSGGDTFEGTGLQFSYEASVLRGALSALRQRNPDVEILVGIGGGDYTNWSQLNVAAIAEFVSHFGLNGVEVCWEPTDPGCRLNAGEIVCSTDEESIAVVRALSKGLPAGSTLSVAAMHVGAYGEGSWADSQPVSAWTGVSLALLRSDVAGSITRLNISAYDAGTAYDPKQALAAYQNYFAGPILLGVAVAPESWGGHVVTLAEVDALANEVKARDAGGMSIWSLTKQPQPGTPSARAISQAICNGLALGDSAEPWPGD